GASWRARSPTSSWVSAATRRCRPSWRRACDASRRWCTSRMPPPASSTGSPCAWAPGRRCRSRGPRPGARGSRATPGGAAPRRVGGNGGGGEVGAGRRRPDPSRPLVTVFGGSLGAGTITDAALGLYERWRDRADVPVHHVTGSRNYEACSARLAAVRRPSDRLDYELVGYEEHMERPYAPTPAPVGRAAPTTLPPRGAPPVP